MIRPLLKYLAYFIGLILVQVLILNNFQISFYLNPYLYILFIILLPFETPGWLLLSSAFFMGLSIDLFPQGWVGQGTTLGVHAGATVFAAYMRPRILVWINPREDYEPGTTPGIKDYGFRWYLTYALLITSIHHFTLFVLEQMSFHRLQDIILRTLLSSAFTLFCILVLEAFRYRRK